VLRDMYMRIPAMVFIAILLIPCALFGFSADTFDPIGEPAVEVIVVEPGQTVNDFLDNRFQAYIKTDIDPGIPPEGDYMGWVTFTNDGERVLLTNRVTDNVTVFDWSTMEVITNIEVGDYPGGIAVSDSYAVVACAFSDEIYIINLDDYAIDTIFSLPSGQQPWVIRMSPDGNKAYVACDISNTCEVFDLQTMEHVLTINDFPISLMSWSMISENGRNAFTFSNFEVTPDGNYLIVGDRADTVFFFNTTNGLIDDTISGIPNCPSVALSGNDSIAVVISTTNPAVIHQIDLASQTVANSVTLTGHSISMAYDVSVNYDGSKAFVAIGGNQSALIRFATSDFVVIPQTYTPFWIGTSPDHSYAISGQYRFSIIDFAAETVIGQYIGNSQYRGAVSPVDARAVGFDFGRHEGIYFYDYATPTAPDYRGTTVAGLEPEGDAPRRVAITPDGSKAVVTNVLSGNAAIVDLSTFTVDTLIPIGDRVQNVAITSDSRWAVVCGFESNSLKIIDLNSNEVVADVLTGSRVGVISISPDDHYAYAGNIVPNTVSVVELAGAASTEIAEIPCGVIGVVWAAYGVSSDVEASPTGEYVLVAASFDDQVKVIDTVSHTVVASLPVGDFPIQIAFNDSGDYATVTNCFDDTYTILHIDGAASSVVGSFSQGDYPLRLAYNPVLDEMGIGYYIDKKVVNINPETGAHMTTSDYSAYGYLMQVLFDENGDPLVLTSAVNSIPGHIHRGAEVIELPAVPSYFDYCPAVQKAVVVMPGPDWISVIEWDTGVKEMTTIPLSDKTMLRSITPNPFKKTTDIRYQIADISNVEMKIYDITGRLVKDLSEQLSAIGYQSSVKWDGTDAEGIHVGAGIYFVEMRTDSYCTTEKILYLK